MLFYFFVFIFSLFKFGSCACRANTIERISKCFSFCPNSTRFTDAEMVCNQAGGHLVPIHDGYTNVLLAQEAAKHFHESTESSFWIGGNNLILQNTWSWTDKSSINFTNWENNEPQNVTGSNCMAASLANGFWKAEDCFKPKPFVCAVSAAPTYPVSANCSSGWTYIAATHSCYGVNYPGPISSWTEAENYCQSFGAHLSSIHSNVELQHLASYLYMMSANVWTGIYSPDSGRTWKTSDDSEVDFLKYANWCGDRPATNITGQRCVTLSCCSCYYDLECTTTAQHALCKKPLF